MRARACALVGVTALLVAAFAGSTTAVADVAAPLALRALSPAAGPAHGGNDLTIAGTNLSRVTAVRFGTAVSHHITHVSAQRLRVRVPEHAPGTVDVRLVAGTRRSSVTSRDHYSFTGTAGDLQWGAPQSIDPSRGDLTSVSCGTPSFCVAIESRDSGQNRLVRFRPSVGSLGVTTAPGTQIDQVTCASSTYCVAGTAAAATEWDGHAWSAVHQLANWSATDAMSCAPQSELCVLAGDATTLVHHADGWHTVALPTGMSTVDVSCPTATFCLATDGATWTVFDGSSWGPASPLQNGPSYLGGLSCASASYCLLTGDYWAAAWRPSGWHALPARVTDQDLSSPVCTAADDCLVTMRYSELRRWDGTTLSRLPDAPVDLSPLAVGPTARTCLPGAGCVFVDRAGHDVDLGPSHTWSAAHELVAASGSLTAVSCTSASWCLAVDDKGNSLTWHAGTWSAPRRIDRLGNLTSVSCVSSEFCVAVGTHVVVRTGGRWRAPVAADKLGLSDVSCSTARFCMAVDAGGRAIAWRGHGWSAPMPIGSRQLLAVSCPTATSCLAVGDMTAHWDGRRWAQIGSAPQSSELTDVDCVSASYCTAGGVGGYYVRNDGLWSRRIAPTSGIDGAWLSCTSVRLCVGEVDIYGGTDVRAYAFDGASIRPHAHYDVGGVPDCVPGLCLAVGADSAVVGRR